AWKALSVFAAQGKKQLLHNLHGRVTSGLYAIMGPSGSGKTTLLNTLACRLDHTAKVCENKKQILSLSLSHSLSFLSLSLSRSLYHSLRVVRKERKEIREKEREREER